MTTVYESHTRWGSRAQSLTPSPNTSLLCQVSDKQKQKLVFPQCVVNFQNALP